jgi:hypothetical protein
VSGAREGRDLFERFEREVRTPREALLVDAFLPPAEAIPSALRRPAAPRPAPAAETAAEPDFSATLAGARQRVDDDPGQTPGPPARRRSRRAAQPEKSLEEEIAEFMSRSGGALAPDSDPEKG